MDGRQSRKSSLRGGKDDHLECYLMDVLTIGNERLLLRKDKEEDEEEVGGSPTEDATSSCSSSPTEQQPRFIGTRTKEAINECCPQCCPSAAPSPSGSISSGSSVPTLPPYYVRLRRDLATLTPPPITTKNKFGVDRRGRLVIDYSHNWKGLEALYLKLKS